MSELIVELGCEDVPARFVEPTLEAMQRGFEAACAELRLSHGAVRAVGTPRRLTLIVKDVAARQEDLEEERTGPPARAAFRDGQPTKAAEGFARGQGVAVEDLYLVDTPKGEYVAAKVFEAGAEASALLPGIIEGVLGKLTFPKSMRWGAGRAAFARPVRWLVVVLDGEVLPVTFATVESGNVTVGHRFAAPEPIVVTDAEQYEAALTDAHVMLDQGDRRARIRALLAAAARETGGHVIEDAGLVDEVCHLVEKPHAVVVTFDEAYLELPDEVLITSMRSHQRYFAIQDDQGRKLINACAVIYNTPVRDASVVRAGNLRVLKARLDDARFFWAQDKKVRLDAQMERLERVVWLAGLGSMRARAERISQLAGAIASAAKPGDEVLRLHAMRAGFLSKADLVTNMVNEFTDLQGVMGREYARLQGEPEAVAVAIHEQYLPKAPTDPIPGSDAGACVALAERLDALVGCFGMGLIPKSSADPYALRRAAIGLLRIVQERGYSLGVQQLITMSREVYAARGEDGSFKLDGDALTEALIEFITTRQKYLLADRFPVDVVDAVLAVAADEIVSVNDRVRALAALRDEADFEPLAIGFKRVVNILRKQADAHIEIPATVDPARFEDDAERALDAAATTAAEAVTAALSTRDWPAACRALITLKAPIDTFFDDVMVMTDDEALRLNRVALLDRVRRDVFMRVADVSMIQV